MKLTAKLVTAIVFGMIILIVIDSVILIRRTVSLFDSDMKSDADVIVGVMRPILEDEWAANGFEFAKQIIDDANSEETDLHFRWVWLDTAADDPLRPQLPQASLDSVRRGSDMSVKATGHDGREYLFTYTPLLLAGERPAALELSESIAPIDNFTHSIRDRAVALGFISAILGAAVVFSLGFFVVGRPLHAIIGKVRRIGTGNLNDTLVVRGHDELRELASAVNSMCHDLAEARERVQAETVERIKVIEQLRHADRLATVGTLASGIAHELGTPLNVVSIRAGLIVKDVQSPDNIHESAEIIRAQATRMTTIIRQLLEFARRQAPSVIMVDVADLLRECAKLLSSFSHKSNVEIAVPSELDTPSVAADPGQLQQVFANLIMNAIQAMPRGGRIELTLRSIHAKPPRDHQGHEGEYLRIDVKDEGVGISAENLHHIFDPFFTTKDVGKGTGLGLSIAYGIVSEHGGWIDVASRPNEGSCFSVFLPRE